ncbi:unnamed protein product [Dovyalis caffra]|uniref:UPF3 domain-containing protein n=1 Tax=Dovyalis caffra TaxID=77055 RepID=A0AAV1SUI8_9ROSI|nr:unnamed protein product [Dovyalis caffra]
MIRENKIGKGGGQSDKTKVVVRHLPPGISQPMFVEQIDVVFSGRYNWLSFRPGSQKHQSYSRAYIDFRRPEDVFDFAEFFNGHLFVNEKGTQFKAIVEYAPSQRAPKQWSKKDGREGTILKDPEYLEFLEFIAKPVENLPSAEIQLERREAERAGAAKDAPIVTPLMDFVRQKRAAKNGPRRILSNGKLSRRAGGSGSPSSSSSKRGSEKKRTMNLSLVYSSSLAMLDNFGAWDLNKLCKYHVLTGNGKCEECLILDIRKYVLRDTAKSSSGKDKSTYVHVPKRDDHQLSKAVTLGSGSGIEVLEDESGVSGITDTGKKKILLLKGKEKEISQVTGTMSQQQSISSSDKNTVSSTALKSQRREASGSGRIIRSILLNKDSRQIQSSGVQSEPQMQTINLDKDKRPPRPQHAQLVSKDANGTPDDKVVGNDSHGFPNEKQERRTRNKDRPDRVVWTPLRRSDGSYASDESLSSSAFQSTQSVFDSSQGNHGDAKVDTLNLRSGEIKALGGGRSNHSSLDNGSHKHFGRRGPSHIVRDADGSTVEGKTLKRGGASGYGSHEVLTRVKYQQWIRFFFGKPRRKCKVDINDAGIDAINTWVDEIPILFKDGSE